MRGRLILFGLLTGVEVISAQLLQFVPRGHLYFAACGLINLVPLWVFTGSPDSGLMVDLAKLTAAQIFIQFIGWVRYTGCHPPDLYNVGIHFIVVVTYLRLLWIGPYDGSFSRHSYWHFLHLYLTPNRNPTIEVPQCSTQ